jgi:hypothetical protein
VRLRPPSASSGRSALRSGLAPPSRSAATRRIRSATSRRAAKTRPFVYVPLRRHVEQNLHVRHRLEGYGAGTCLEYPVASDPDALAAAVLSELDRVVDYKPVEADGAARAAALIGALL